MLIIILLVVIITILVPWVLGLLVAAAAVYGAWVLIVASLGAGALLLSIVFLAVRAVFFPKKTPADALAVSNKEFNRKYVEQAKKEGLAREVSGASANDQPEKLSTCSEKELAKAPAPYSPRMITCSHCVESIPKYTLWCPKCGKDPKLIRKPII
ncbi:hypothetical protein [Pseudomonas fluorescens]|uniref:Uncharacterized protein n=1 Tax=Pseudomonas fluorescens TaxID=294 RepID=A0A5E6ZFG4_PSEFL|nr:hypothetical protein [Pseudomonas fluorescens]VVN64505.1 hypothetical protein PS723_00004 [Pseudomonas fluorescens]